MKLTVFVFLIAAIYAFSESFDQYALARSQAQNTLDLKINSLVQAIQNSQNKRDTEYNPKFLFPPKTWTAKKGLLSSFIHLNFQGKKLQTNVRNYLTIKG
jgi:hypothetical protein